MKDKYIKLKALLLTGTIAVTGVGLSIYEDTVHCDINGKHAHYYVSDDDFGRYIVSERKSVSGLERSDDYIPVNSKETNLLRFINTKKLYRIDDNKQAIKNIIDTQEDYVEYRYKYHYLMPMVISNGKTVNTILIPMVGYSWTTDTSKNLTGETRICHYIYYGYKVVENISGSFDLTKSEPVDDLSELPSDYEYIKEKFYKVVNLNDKDKELDYEDGPDDDKKLISEDEYNKEKGKTKTKKKKKR